MTVEFLPRTRLRRLPERLAFPAIIIAFLAIVSQTAVPSPLYPVYEVRFGLQPVEITIVFAAYVVGIVAALLTVGALSDFVGRRPLILASALLMAASAALFLDAHGLTLLVIARILQGLGIGTGTSALAAALTDFAPRGDTRVASIFAGALPPTSLCLGALWGGFAVQLPVTPDVPAYGACLAEALIASVIVLVLPERQTPRVGAWASLRPRLAVPESTRAAFRAVVGALIAGWALIGLYLALMPSVLALAWPRTDAIGQALPISGALAAAALAGLALARTDDRRAMRISLTALTAGSAVAALALFSPGIPWPLLAPATAAVGFGFGGTFQSALRHIMAVTAPPHRAAVLATALTISFTALGLPSVLAGALVPVAGVQHVAGAYVIVMLATSMATAVGYARHRPGHGSPRVG
jgi:predicted MFS family arabinose efflux permease